MAEAAQLGRVPDFHARRMLLVSTGSLAAAFLPYWTNWLRMAYPDLERRIVLTRSATRFVSRSALTALENRGVDVDEWPDGPEPGSRHVELATWPDSVIVYPATFHFLARYAQGLADTPVTLALQCTSAVVGLAPAVPPGGVQSPGYRRHVDTLRALPNVVLTDPVPGRSAHTGREDASVSAPLPDLLRAVETRRRLLAKTEAEC